MHFGVCFAAIGQRTANQPAWRNALGWAAAELLGKGGAR